MQLGKLLQKSLGWMGLKRDLQEDGRCCEDWQKIGGGKEKRYDWVVKPDQRTLRSMHDSASRRKENCSHSRRQCSKNILARTKNKSCPALRSRHLMGVAVG